MQNNDLIGKVVLSKAGRDINHLYVVVRQIDNDYVLLANGDTKSVDMPKKKKIKHLIILEDIDEELLSFLLILIEKDRILYLKEKLVEMEKIDLERKIH